MHEDGHGHCGGDSCPIRELLNLRPEWAHRSSWALAWGLPRRRARVAALMLQGLRDREIAECLGLTSATVRTYCREVLAAAGVGNRAQLIMAALRAAVAGPTTVPSSSVDPGGVSEYV